MIYRDFCGDKLSMLGMGCMRFPCRENGEVDLEKTAGLIDLCIKNGVNYFDTAWFYHEGKSEKIIGNILKNYDRSSFNLATKMPWTDINSAEDVEKIFNTQLENTKAEYFDYYLIHNVSEDTIDVFNNESFRIVDFLYGTIYAIGGDLQKLGGGIFLCTPKNVNVEGKISDDAQAAVKQAKGKKEKEEEDDDDFF